MITKYTKKDVKGMLRKELREYEATFGYMTSDERKELREWVASGNQAICNPWYLYGENGHPLDFVTASRIAEDMLRNPEDYGIGVEPDICNGEEDEDIPF